MRRGIEDSDEHEPMWRRYLRFWRADTRADIDEELRFHVESRTADFIAEGMTPDAARRAATKRFGDVPTLVRTLRGLSRERELTMRRMAWLEHVRHDLRFASRQLLRNPGFTVVAILTLALGIGANTAIFSVVYSVLLRPLPYAHAERLLSLRQRNGPNDTNGMVVTFGNFGAWQEQSRTFESFAAWTYGGFTLTGAGDPQRIQAYLVNAGYWETLAIPPALGRYFRDEEDRPGAAHVVVLSHALWRSTFNGDSGIVGRAITLAGIPYTVVGVASPSYAFGPQSDLVWVPIALGPRELSDHADHELAVVGLMRPGVSAGAAIADLESIEVDLARVEAHPTFDGHVIARPMRDTIVGDLQKQLLILFGAVGLVLLIACANVTNLLLARAAVRQRELAVRGALGAGRTRIVAQLLAESLLLAVAGSAAGMAVAAGGVHFFVHTAPGAIPRLQDAALNGVALAFAVGLAVLTSLIFGLLPAVKATRQDIQATLRDGGRGSAASSVRLRSALVVAEVSVALVLLVGAGLLVRSAILLQRVPLGFDTRNLLVASTSLPASRYPPPEGLRKGYERILTSVSSIPGIRSAALVSRIPVGAGGYDCTARAEGSTVGDGSGADANLRVATPNYFATIGLPLVRGRTFDPSDVATSTPVVIINAALARRLFGDADPVGRRLAHCDGDQPTWRTVVGVTGDMHARGQDQGVVNEVYYSSAQRVEGSQYIVIRGDVPVMTLVPALRRAVTSVDPLLALSGLRTMDAIVARSLAGPRFNTMLLLLLGATGLVLAAVGIYGVVAYIVTQRTAEIGIRLALGANGRSVVSMVVWRGVLLAGAGVAIGIVAALATSRLLATLLYGVKPRDPLTFVAVGLSLVIVAACASFIPARRAARLDPIGALRN